MAVNIGVNIQRKRGVTSGSGTVAGAYPDLLIDVDDAYFRANGGSKAFSEVVTHSRSGNATMVDSDGLLKWAPHNLVTYSEQFDNAAWNAAGVSQNTSRIADQTTAPDGTFTADEIRENTDNDFHYIRQSVTKAPATYTYSVYAKPNGRNTIRINFGSSGDYHAAFFNVSTGTVGTEQGSATGSIENVGDGWYRCVVTATTINTSAILQIDVMLDDETNLYQGDGTSGIYIWGAHLYRSDLGGMVDNPDQPASLASYVPTTSSAVYLPRRGHHVYNGSAWVNEGLLHESEARTNLFASSTGLFTGLSSGVTATLSQANSLTGLSDASLWDDGTSGGIHRITEQATSVVGGTTYTISVFARNVDRQYINLLAHAGAGTYAGGVFDISNGTVKETAAAIWAVVGGNIEDFGGGWYRCSLSFTPSSSVTAYPAVYMSDGSAIGNYGTATYTGSNKTLYAFGLQLEAAPTPSSYIPTAGATVTRAAETLTIPAANLPWPTETYGPELVTNGTFDTDTSGWTAQGSNTIASVGGELEITLNSALFSGAIQYFSLEVGKSYLVSGQGRRGTSISSFVVRIFDNTTLKQNTISTTSNKEFSFLFTASGTSGGIRVSTVSSNGSGTIYVDNISVREVIRYPVSIQMNGRMTYADENLTNQHQFVRWRLDNDNRIETYISTSVGTGFIGFQQEALNVLDNVNSSTTAYTPGILVPYNIASRHGMTFINGAVDGVALTGNNSPTNLPDLSATDLNLGYDMMGTIKTFRMWGVDLADAGIALAATTAPSIYGLPTISGEINDPEVGETLAAVSAPVVLGAPTPSTTWQWLRDGLVILGATSSSYVLTNDDLGSKISVKQAITNAGGSAFSTSAETATVTGIPATATQQRDGAYIFDRANSYIEVRA